MSMTELAASSAKTTTTMLSQSSTTKKTNDASAGAGATPAKADAKAKDDPAYTISGSMESLLDGLTGGGSKPVDASVARAQQAERIMRNVQSMSKAITEATTRAMDLIKGDLGKIGKSFGMSDDDVSAVLGGFNKHMQDQMKNFDFHGVSLDIQQSNTQMSLESHGIELTIQDGDRSVRISYAKSTLHMEKDDQSLQASLGKGGQFDFAYNQNNMTVDGKATGMIVRSNGFSDEEIKGVLDKLNGLNGKDGMSGLAVLKPTTSADGVMHLNLDLSVPLEGITSGAATAGTTAAAPAATSKLDVKA